MFPGSASDTGNTGVVFANYRERNGMTDYQVFRLFLVGMTSQNEYRKIGSIGYSTRGIGVSNISVFQTVLNNSVLGGPSPQTLLGVISRGLRHSLKLINPLRW